MQSIKNVLVRDLEAVKQEVLAYSDEESLWQCPPGISNSGGNLALHVAGNLQHFVGGLLGGSGYVRDRESEFEPAPKPRSFLLAELEAAKSVVATTLDELSDSRCCDDFPVDLAGRRLSIEQFLVHLATHLAFHLGQIDYHRRILSGIKGDVTPVSIALI